MYGITGLGLTQVSGRNRWREHDGYCLRTMNVSVEVAAPLLDGHVGCGHQVICN